MLARNCEGIRPLRSALLVSASSHPPEESGADRCNTNQTKCNYPGFGGVGSHAEGMSEGNRPAEIYEPMQRTPGRRPDPRSQETRNEHSQHEVETNGPDTDPQSAVRRGEGDEYRRPANMYISVEQTSDYMDADEDYRQYGDSTVNLLLCETRPVSGSRPVCCDKPKEQGRRE